MQAIKKRSLAAMILLSLTVSVSVDAENQNAKNNNTVSTPTTEVIPSASVIAKQLENESSTVKSQVMTDQGTPSQNVDYKKRAEQYENSATIASQDAQRLSSSAGALPGKQIPTVNLEQIDSNQERLIGLLEDKFVFEKERKSLENQLALEKLRSELRKLNYEHPVNSDSFGAKESSAEPGTSTIRKPFVVMVSEIAGSKRVVINDSGAMKIVKDNELFHGSDGKGYRLLKKANGFDLKEQ